MRLVTLSALFMIGCADAELTSLDIGEMEVSKARGEDDTPAPTMAVYLPVDGPVTGLSNVQLPPHEIGGETLNSDADDAGDDGDGDANKAGDDGDNEPINEVPGDDNEQPPPAFQRPVAVMFVVDQNADMSDVRHLLSDPVVVGARALMEGQGESWFGLVGHVDRRAHLLYSLERVEPQHHRLMMGAAAGVTTCSTLEDMHGWVDSGYDNPVLVAPPCWADEFGHDPATALAFAHHMLERNAPFEAEKAIVWIGARPPTSIVSTERRPAGYPDQVETWRRTDREVPSEILAAHTQFVTSEVQATGVRVLHVPVADAVDMDWVSMTGAELAPGNTVGERSVAVQALVNELRAAAAQ